MPSIDWNSYVGLCDQMWGQRGAWYGATNLAELTEHVTKSCPDVVGGTGGFTALTAALADGRTDDEVARLVRFAALSRPAADYAMGADYTGWFVSEYPAGTLVCATERFAELSVWTPIGAPAPAATGLDGLTYDAESGLYYDAENWYLPDRITVVTPDPDAPDRFRDAHGTVYVHGQPLAATPQRNPAAPTDEVVLGNIVATSLDEAMKLVPGAENLPPERLRALVAEVLGGIPT